MQLIRLSGVWNDMRGSEKDTAILEGLRNGDEEALKELFKAYYSALCLYSVQITESLQQSEDIVQELFIDIWEKKRYNNINVDLGAYLYYAVRNQSMAYARKNFNHLAIQDLEEEAYTPIEELYNEEELLERKEQLHQTLKMLSPQEYRVLTEIVLNGKKYKEVAAELSISVNTVKTHLSRALKILRKDKTLTLFFLCFC